MGSVLRASHAVRRDPPGAAWLARCEDEEAIVLPNTDVCGYDPSCGRIPMRLTRYTDYGLRVLMLLSIRPKDVISTEEIAQTFGISKDHLHKIVQDLSRRGWVESRRGPTGGVAFVECSRELTIGEIVRALESQFDLVECFDEKTNECPITEACRLAPILDEARDSFLAVLDDHTLGELTRRPAQLRALLPVEPRERRAAGRSRR